MLHSRAEAEASVSADINVDDVLHLANGVALAAESTPDAARSADILMAIVVNEVVSPKGSTPVRNS
jgi:hypothetical protein